MHSAKISTKSAEFGRETGDFEEIRCTVLSLSRSKTKVRPDCQSHAKKKERIIGISNLAVHYYILQNKSVVASAAALIISLANEALVMQWLDTKVTSNGVTT